jgi:hypothetical protein
MSPLAQILAATNRSLNDGLLALALVVSILIAIIIAAAETVGPITV